MKAILQRYIGFDVETTGFDPANDCIIQIAAVRVEDGRPVARWSSLIDPGRSIPRAVQLLTGITDEMVKDQPTIEQALPLFLDFVGDGPLVAHNAPFDRAFLSRALGRLGKEDTALPVYDTLAMARLLLPAAGGYRLESLAAGLDVPLVRAHDAAADAEAAALVFARLQRKTAPYPRKALSLAARWLRPVDPLLADILEEAALETGEEPELTRPKPAGDPDGTTARPPKRGKTDFDPEAVARWFGPDGPLAAILPGYEPREGQERMARLVADAFQQGGRLMVEAGTGTGKSMAYLFPAVAWAVSAREPVVVSTYTITLQEQLWREDIPRLKAAAPVAFHASLVKGRSNYLCPLKWEEMDPSGEVAAPIRSLYARIVLWSSRGTGGGDRADYHVRWEEEAGWLAVAADDSCLGERCRHAHRCPFLSARRDAEEADIIVVNHALLLSAAASGGEALPPYRRLICDEAHHLPEVASRQLATRFDQQDVTRLLNSLLKRGTPPGLLDRLSARPLTLGGKNLATALQSATEDVQNARKGVDDLFRSLRVWAGADGEERAGAYPVTTVRIPRGGDDATPDDKWKVVKTAAENLEIQLRDLSGRLERLSDELSNDISAGAGDRETAAGLDSRRHQVVAAAEALMTVFADSEGEENVAWLELVQSGGRLAARVLASPMNCGQALNEVIFSHLETCVATSATLSIGGSFDYLASELGLEDARATSVSSPFDYPSQALLCIPTDVPDLRSAERAFLDEASRFLVSLGRELQGRTLILFTSNRMLRDVHERIKEPLETAGIGVLAQGIDGHQARLAASFREVPRTILLGSASLWEGVDIPGDALSCVVLMRLPFRAPGHPLVEARMEALAARGEDPFRRLTVPDAVIRFKQGFGRLIRRSGDRGAVVVMDQRLLKQRGTYGQAFLSSLPDPRLLVGTRETILQGVKQWVDGGNIGDDLPAEMDVAGSG